MSFITPIPNLGTNVTINGAAIDLRHQLVVEAFNKLPEPSITGKGFAEPLRVGTPVDANDAVTKYWVESQFSNSLDQIQPIADSVMPVQVWIQNDYPALVLQLDEAIAGLAVIDQAVIDVQNTATSISNNLALIQGMLTDVETRYGQIETTYTQTQELYAGTVAARNAAQVSADLSSNRASDSFTSQQVALQNRNQAMDFRNQTEAIKDEMVLFLENTLDLKASDLIDDTMTVSLTRAWSSQNTKTYIETHSAQLINEAVGDLVAALDEVLGV